MINKFYIFLISFNILSNLKYVFEYLYLILIIFMKIKIIYNGFLYRELLNKFKKVNYTKKILTEIHKPSRELIYSIQFYI